MFDSRISNLLFVRIMMVSALLLAAACLSAAGETGTSPMPEPKDDSHVGQNPGTPDGREGGETIPEAFPIGGFPFSDSGNTCDNIHDYDEACPYEGSTAPDVVYSYTPTEDIFIDIDLCGSGYDTKVYVYCAGPGSLVACNDDYYFGPPCGEYVSRLPNVMLIAGLPYYIVVDGYGIDCGDYVIEITETTGCVVECPAGGVPEGEPPLHDDYVDNYNGGCNSTPPVFQTLEAVDDPDCITLCGVTGNYTYMGVSYRDTDWFEVVSVGNSIECAIAAEWPVYLFDLAPTDCAGVAVNLLVEVLTCPDQYFLSIPSSPGMLHWLWVGPNAWGIYPMNYDYILDVCGIFGTVATENASWGGVKEMYK